MDLVISFTFKLLDFINQIEIWYTPHAYSSEVGFGGGGFVCLLGFFLVLLVCFVLCLGYGKYKFCI